MQESTYNSDLPVQTDGATSVEVQRVVMKGTYNCKSQDSRKHQIKRNIATYGGVGDLNEGERYKFEYEVTREEKHPDNPTIDPQNPYSYYYKYFLLTGGLYIGCSAESVVGLGCADMIMVDRFSAYDRFGSLNLVRTYKEDWAGFMISYHFSDSAQIVITTPLTCKRTVLVP